MATRLTTVQLQCDRCPAIRQAKLGDPIVVLRAQLSAVGWLCRDGVDVCPACRAKGA